MNKKELIQAAALKSGQTQAQTENALSAILETISGSLDKEDTVVLQGFGTFSIKERKARKGVNPSTGASMDIAAKKVVHFKASAKR